MKFLWIWRSLHLAGRRGKPSNGDVNKVGIQGFPTTWFLNREGWIAFLKRGWTKELEEEFSWRIEALRNELLAQNCISTWL